MHKEKIHKLFCTLCAFTVFGTLVPLPASADDISGRTAGAYAYVLNDFMEKYGTITEENDSPDFSTPNGLDLNGVYYSDVIDFDNNGDSYLVVFTLNSAERCAEANIWSFDEKTNEPAEVAKLSKSYAELPPNISGEFYIGYNDEKRYIAYKEHLGDTLVTNEYYTVISGDAFMYVNPPHNVDDLGIMSFSSVYFHSGIDISGYNKQLDTFFMNLKNESADSVDMDDMADCLSQKDEQEIEKVLSKAVNYKDFDISNFSSMEDYKTALQKTENSDKFYLITNMYNLGDEIYYVRFSTDRSFYNYTLLRRSDSAQDGYQILKVRTDCIPLSDRELMQIKEEYSRNPLLLKKASGKIKEKKEHISLKQKLNLPHINVTKCIDTKWRIPAAFIGGGFGLGLIIALWFVLLNDDKK